MNSENLCIAHPRFHFYANEEDMHAPADTLFDLSGGGFSSPPRRIIEAAKRQAACLPLSGRVFFSRPLADFVKKLAAVMPPGLEVCYPCNSPAEAIEGAVKLAKGVHKKRPVIVAFHQSWHGSTWGALSFCGQPRLREPLRAFPLKTRFLAFGDESQLEKGISTDTACVIFEPFSALFNCEKERFKPYLQALVRRCKDTGALLVVDETQVGLGFCGGWTWCQANDVQPDVLALGNLLGAGILPAGAYVTKNKWNQKVYGRSHPAKHGGTTAGNPLNCAIGAAVLDCIEQENWLQKAAAHAATLAGFLNRWQQAGQLRIVQAGMMAGIQFPNRESWLDAMRRCHGEGLLASVFNAQPNVLLLHLPLDISHEKLTETLTKLQSILSCQPILT